MVHSTDTPALHCGESRACVRVCALSMYIYNLPHSEAQWSTIWTYLHYTVGRISLWLVCVCVCVCVCTCTRVCAHTCTYVHLHWNLNPPFLKGPWMAKNKWRRMTVVRKAPDVSKNETTKRNVSDNCLVFNLMSETKYSHIKFQNVLFVTPANSAHAREWFNSFVQSIGFGKTHPHCSRPLLNHSIFYLCWKCHMWATQGLQLHKNWGPHPSWHLARSIHSGRHLFCEI
jgi:hypothetical protein